MSDKNISVTIDGKSHTLDFNRAKELGLLKEVVERKIGYVYKNINGRTFTLTRFLVELTDSSRSKRFLTYVSLVGAGHPWTKGVLVKNYDNITDNEWEEITAKYDFTLVSNKQ